MTITNLRKIINLFREASSNYKLL